jgi:hypothetical protein
MILAMPSSRFYESVSGEIFRRFIFGGKFQPNLKLTLIGTFLA